MIIYDHFVVYLSEKTTVKPVLSGDTGTQASIRFRYFLRVCALIYG